MSSMTTIRISPQTKDLLDDLKHHPKESYEEVAVRLATMARDDEPLSDNEIEDMKSSRDDIKAGQIKSLKTIRTELGIWLPYLGIRVPEVGNDPRTASR
jgi:hypothetical protein